MEVAGVYGGLRDFERPTGRHFSANIPSASYLAIRR
jgi:hypothetical protein